MERAWQVMSSLNLAANWHSLPTSITSRFQTIPTPPKKSLVRPSAKSPPPPTTRASSRTQLLLSHPASGSSLCSLCLLLCVLCVNSFLFSLLSFSFTPTAPATPPPLLRPSADPTLHNSL